MKKTIDEDDFISAFTNWEGRENQFSVPALRALFSYLENYEEETGEELELDVIAICCEYSEYESAQEAAEQYNGAVEVNKDFDEEDKENAALAWLEDQTIVIKFDGGVVIQSF